MKRFLFSFAIGFLLTTAAWGDPECRVVPMPREKRHAFIGYRRVGNEIWPIPGAKEHRIEGMLFDRCVFPITWAYHAYIVNNYFEHIQWIHGPR